MTAEAQMTPGNDKADERELHLSSLVAGRHSRSCIQLLVEFTLSPLATCTSRTMLVIHFSLRPKSWSRESHILPSSEQFVESPGELCRRWVVPSYLKGVK
ncbi:hypothetical protein CDAR_305851 [Caerostris darwini]|uniref:Uncharacterized protein n=1 Tax=Caerostris darwini TaxID=1538125 RepID=A0AAV4VR31_9ARAC|nr:hypothetical protein CDAR_305851 [Caerostris darwini]